MDMMAWALHHEKQMHSNLQQEPQLQQEQQFQMTPVSASAQQIGNTLKNMMQARKQENKQKQKQEAVAANRMKPGILPYEGCNLLSQFTRFHLHEQK